MPTLTLQFKLDVTVTPKTATLKVDGTVQPLTEGKYEADVEFEKEVELVVEQEGYTPETKKVKISADNEKNKVVINLKKANVRTHTVSRANWFTTNSLTV